jgi:hypothetical protein
MGVFLIRVGNCAQTYGCCISWQGIASQPTEFMRSKEKGNVHMEIISLRIQTTVLDMKEANFIWSVDDLLYW